MEDINKDKVREFYNNLVTNGIGKVLAAESAMKRAGDKYALLEALVVLVEATIQERHVNLEVGDVSRAFHRHFMKHFGTTSVMEAIIESVEWSPVQIEQKHQSKKYVIMHKSAPVEVFAPGSYQDVRRKLSVEVLVMQGERKSSAEVSAYVQTFRDKHGVSTFKDPDGPPLGETFVQID